MTARVLNVPKQTLSNWVRLAAKSELQGAGDRPVSAEQMELARRRAELARVKMERDILRKSTAAQAACAEPGKGAKYAWIAQNKAVWPVSMACEVLGVSTRAKAASSIYSQHGPELAQVRTAEDKPD